MKLIRIIIVLLTINLLGCGYQPLLTNSDINISIKNIEMEGDKKINNLIKKKLPHINNNVGSTLFLISNFEKKIISKDTKGDPSIFEAKVIVNYKLINDEKILINKINEKRITYNNISDKFELEKYENNIIGNLIENISQNIITDIRILTNDN